MSRSNPIHSPLRTVGATEHRQSRPSAGRIRCDICGKLFCESAVATSAHRYEEDLGSFAALRQLFCDHCDHVQVWHQATTADGVLLDVILSAAPGFMTSPKDIARFLQRHPECAGVGQN